MVIWCLATPETICRKKSASAASGHEPVSPLIVVWFVLTVCQVATGVAAAGVQGVNGGGVGQDTDDVLADWLGMGDEDVAKLRAAGAVA